MARYLADSMLGTCRRPLSLVFLGCGTGEHEKRLTIELLGTFAINRVCLMDKDFNNVMNVNAAEMRAKYAIDVARFSSYTELAADLRCLRDDTFVLPLGINNSVSFGSAQEMWEAYNFFALCEALTQRLAPNMARSYVNFLDNSSGLYKGYSHDVLTSEISVAKKGWWTSACDLVTCEGAKAVVTTDAYSDK